jgi:hypothetical protein
MASSISDIIELLLTLGISLTFIAFYFGYFIRPVSSDENILDDQSPKKTLKGNKILLISGIGLFSLAIIRFLFA